MRVSEYAEGRRRVVGDAVSEYEEVEVVTDGSNRGLKHTGTYPYS